MKRWLKWTLLGLLAVFVIAALMAVWVTTTTSGLRFTLARAAGFLDNKLRVGEVDGSLLGGMHLRNLVYDDPTVAGTYRVADIIIAPYSRRLLSGELHLTGLTVRGIDATLPPPADDVPPSDEPFALPELAAPISLIVDDLLIEDVRVQQHDATPVIALDRIAGGASWVGKAITIPQLTVNAPEGQLGVAAAVDTGDDWRGQAGIDFDWRLPDQPEALVGRVELAGPQSRPRLNLDLRAPSSAVVDLDWEGQGDTARWQLHARSSGIELARLMPEPPLQTVAFDLRGSGGIGTADVSGQISLDDYPVAIERLAGSFHEQVLVIDALALAEVDGPGRINARGRVDLSGEVPTGEVDATWQAINPPLAAPFDQLASAGAISATGNLERLAASIRADARVDGQAVGVALDVHGDPQGELHFAPLEVTTGNGRLAARGHVVVQPVLSWQADINASDFNPGLLVADWPGRVNLDADVSGNFADDTLTLQARIESLGGTLRQRALAGSGQVDITNGDTITAELDLRLGSNRVRLDGLLGERYDARVQLNVDDPALLLDQAQGHLEADLRVRGQWPGLAIAGTASASDFALGETRVGVLALDVDMRTDFSEAGEADIRANDITVAGETIRTLTLVSSGNEQDNRWRLDVDAERGTLGLALAGRVDRAAGSWSGQLRELAVNAPQLPRPLTLTEPAALSLSAEAVELGRACLGAEDSRLCLDGQWRSASGADFGYELSRLPLAWLTALAGNDQLLVDGELGGRGRLRLDADNRLTGQAQIEGTPGRVRFAQNADQDLVGWTVLATTIDFQESGGQSINADIELTPNGHVRAQIDTVPGETDTALSGDISLAIPDLAFLDLLTPELVRPAGQVNGRMTLSGSLAAPGATGEIMLSGFASEIPAAGLRVRDTHLTLRGGSGGRITVDGRVVTAEDSALAIGGWLELPTDGVLPMEITISGERVLVADIPAARVFATPDLRITSNRRGLGVTGSVDIPQAMIRPEELEGGATRPSPDVQVTDEAAVAEEAAGLPVTAMVQVSLGDRVRVEGYGLKGSLAGRLQIRERPARPTNARGEISVTGTYQAYGQDLDIERGRLIFSGPIDNPNLDIRATRKVETVTAGLQVTGNAQRPILEVYSVPAMDQAEALSYLVLGRPLRQATSSADQDALGTAAAAVSTAGGDLLAKSLGARLGLDEVGVGSSRELGAGALTIGKYLSPRLYMGYGRSLFDGGQLLTLRYRLTERFEAEVQSGNTDNKAGLNYRYER